LENWGGPGRAAATTFVAGGNDGVETAGVTDMGDVTTSSLGVGKIFCGFAPSGAGGIVNCNVGEVIASGVATWPFAIGRSDGRHDEDEEAAGVGLAQLAIATRATTSALRRMDRQATDTT